MPAELPMILIVEDEQPMRRFLHASLSLHGFRTLEATSGSEAIQLVASNNPDLVILDLGLPDRDGIEVTRHLRGWSAVPIIVVSARDREGEKVTALDAGADDYLTKPFGVNELLARIRVALRHAAQRASGTTTARIQVGPLVIDCARHRVDLDGREVKLTLKGHCFRRG